MYTNGMNLGGPFSCGQANAAMPQDSFLTWLNFLLMGRVLHDLSSQMFL